jgi:protoporphyrinogen oxidase
MADEISKNLKNSSPLLIIGAGIVGLTLAQGCREAKIPFEIYEQDATERSQGWGLSLHWCLDDLERVIGPELSARIAEVHLCDLLQDQG